MAGGPPPFGFAQGKGRAPPRLRCRYVCIIRLLMIYQVCCLILSGRTFLKRSGPHLILRVSPDAGIRSRSSKAQSEDIPPLGYITRFSETDPLPFTERAALRQAQGKQAAPPLTTPCFRATAGGLPRPARAGSGQVKPRPYNTCRPSRQAASGRTHRERPAQQRVDRANRMKPSINLPLQRGKSE